MVLFPLPLQKYSKIFLCFFCIILSLNLFAQNVATQTIRGLVVDADNEYPLPGATVQISINDSLLPIHSISSINGDFELNQVPIGRCDLLITYLGYEDQMLPNLLVVKGKENNLTIRLQESIATLDEVVVRSRQAGEAINDAASTSVSTLETNEIVRFSGTLGDVARMAQNFAGVSGAVDSRNDIIVRGNAPSSVLWRMEGVPIPSPNHWATPGTSGGAVSMLNTNNLSASDFLSGAFPASYGNVTGAVFDLRLRNGNPNKYEFLAQVGFNGFEAGVEGPIKFAGKGASFLANYRYSTLALVNDLGLSAGTGGAVPRYQDLTFKINLPTAKAGNFSLWGMGGNSLISFLSEETSDNMYSIDDENLESASRTGMVGLTHRYFFNPETSSFISAALSGFQNINTVDRRVPTDSTRYHKYFEGITTQRTLAVNWSVTHKMSSQQLIKTGVIVNSNYTAVTDSVRTASGNLFEARSFDGNVFLTQIYGEWQYKIRPGLRLNTGLRGALLGLNNAWAAEPRVGVSWKINDKNTLGAAYGWHSQMQPLPIYFNRSQDGNIDVNDSNLNLDFLRSHHWVLSFQHQFTNSLKLKTETYYQQLYNAAVDPSEGSFSTMNLGADFSMPGNTGLTNEGTGYNYGLELTLQQNLNKGFYYLLTGALFQSKYKGADGIERNTYYNGNYVVNALLGKEVKLNKSTFLTFDTKFSYAGGRRYTPIDLAASNLKGEEVLDYTRRYEMQHKPYIRPDLKIGIKMNMKSMTQTWSIDLQNFIGRKNVFMQVYEPLDQSIKTLYQRGFFPDIRYQLLF